jgi:tRNA nucleotidyltransferase (CCA-adding enzyme)
MSAGQMKSDGFAQTGAPHWSHFPHGADVGLIGEGPTREAAFAACVEAMTAAICDPETIVPARPVRIACEGGDDELLLYAFLNALVFEMATRRMLFRRAEVTISGSGAERRRLEAVAWGEPVEPARHQPAVEVKGATMTMLRVAREPDGHWQARCVIDV